MDWVQVRQNVRDLLHGMAYTGYERHLRQERLELEDLFLLMCFIETLGLPNPASLYLLDIYPYVLSEFHLWHRRMGIERSPLANLRCC